MSIAQFFTSLGICWFIQTDETQSFEVQPYRDSLCQEILPDCVIDQMNIISVSLPPLSITVWVALTSLSLLRPLTLAFSHSVSLCMIRWMESMEANLDRELGRAKCQTICLAKDSIPDSDHLNLGNNSLCCWNTDILSFV